MRKNSIYIYVLKKYTHTTSKSVCVCVQKNMYRYVCIYIHTWMQMMWFFQHRVTEIVSQTQTVQVNLNSPEDQFGEDAKRQFFGSNDFITLLHVYITLFLSLYIYYVYLYKIPIPPSLSSLARPEKTLPYANPQLLGAPDALGCSPVLCDCKGPDGKVPGPDGEPRATTVV